MISKRRTVMSRLLVILIAIALLVTIIPMGIQAEELPWIKTDQTDYLAGSTVTLRGGGWTGDTGVAVHVADSGNPSSTIDQVVGVNADGTFVTTFDSFNYYVPYYDVVAIGLESGLVASTTFTDGSAKFTQLETIPAANWVNGNLGKSNAYLVEGMSTAQRLVLEGISGSGDRSVTFNYQFTKGGKHAYDFLTSWGQAVQTAAALGGVTWQDSWKFLGTSFTSSSSMIPVTIPDTDPFAGADRIAAYETSYGNRVVDVYYASGTITSAWITINTTLDGSLSGDSNVEWTLHWQGTATNIMILFGGHVSIGLEFPVTKLGWGTGSGASSISGSPYHHRVKSASDFNPGQMDNMMSADAINFKSALYGYKWNDLVPDGVWDKDGVDNISGTADDEKGLPGWEIWVDVNKNGLKDAGEATLTMSDDAGTPQNETGMYYLLFYLVDQKSTTLNIYETLKQYWVQTYPGTPSYHTTVTLSPGNEYGPYNFGNRLIEPAITVDKMVKVTGSSDQFADFTFITEPSGDVTYRFKVTNTSPGKQPVTLNYFKDSRFTTLTLSGLSWYTSGGTPIADITIHSIAYNDYVYADFATTLVVDASGENPIINTATVRAVDAFSQNTPFVNDSASVFIYDNANIIIQLIKTVAPASRPEPGGDFTYTYTVKNLSSEPVKLTKLTDDVLGTLYEWKTGDPEIWIAVGGEYLLPGTFTKAYTEAGSYTNIAWAYAVDNEGNAAKDDDTKTVTVTDVKPAIVLTKTASPASLPEPGGPFTYTYSIHNDSVENVKLTKVTDDVLGTLYEWKSGDPEIWIQPQADYLLSGTFTKTYTEFGSYTNIAWAYAVDNEGNEAKDDDTKTVTVTDVKPEIVLTKTADPTTLPEPGGPFTYTYSIHNDSVENVKLTKVTDDVLGTLYEWKAGDLAIWIAPQGDYLLPGTFTKTYTEAGSYTNIAWAYAVDNEGNPASDDDTKTVTVTDVMPVIVLTKTASPASLPEPGGPFTYTYSIHNGSVEAVKLTKVTDDVLGTLYEWATGEPEIWIAAGGNYLLPGTFTKTYTEAGVYPNTAWAYAVDNELNEAKDDDSKKVEVTDVKPIIQLIKTADPASRPEPGGLFTYTYTVKNLSVEPVMLTKVTDDVLGTLYEWASPMPEIWIAVGGQYKLPGTFTKPYTEAGSYTNVAWAYAIDNEKNEAKDDDTQTVKVTDVLPTIQLIKTASPASKPEPGGLFTYTYTVKNLSVEPVMLTKVTDDVLGTLYEWASPMPEIWIAVGGQHTLSGTFTKTYTEAGSYTNVAWAYAVDNEKNEAKDDDTQTVTVTDVKPIITVTKKASVAYVLFPGEWVTFSGVVTNKSVEAVSLTSLIDDVYGNLADPANPLIKDSTVTDLPKVLAPEVTYAYSFKGQVTGPVGSDQKDTITATAYDNENNKATASASAAVHIYTQLKVLKTVNSKPFSGPSIVFQIRRGEPGQGSNYAAPLTGYFGLPEIEQQTASEANGGMIDFTTLLNPGKYALCEQVPEGYVPSYIWGTYGIDWFKPGYAPNDPGQEFVFWSAVYFTVHADGTITWQNNTVQPGDRLILDNQVGQAPRTIGYWKNHASFNKSNGGQDYVLDEMLKKLTEKGTTLNIGLLALPGDSTNLATSVKNAFYLLDKRAIDGKNIKMASDAR